LAKKPAREPMIGVATKLDGQPVLDRHQHAAGVRAIEWTYASDNAERAAVFQNGRQEIFLVAKTPRPRSLMIVDEIGPIPRCRNGTAGGPGCESRSCTLDAHFHDAGTRIPRLTNP
jgi:hypothetical protein